MAGRAAFGWAWGWESAVSQVQVFRLRGIHRLGSVGRDMIRVLAATRSGVGPLWWQVEKFSEHGMQDWSSEN